MHSLRTEASGACKQQRHKVHGKVHGAIALAALALVASCSSGQGPTPARAAGQAVHRAVTSNYVYVADIGLSELLVYPAGVNNPAPIASVSVVDPHGVATDPSGNVYVALAKPQQIKVYSSGATSLKYTINSAIRPQAVIVDSAGNVYAADGAGNTVTEYAPGGSTVKQVFNTGSGVRFQPLGGLAIDNGGNLYVDIDDGSVEECSRVTSSCTPLPSNVAGPGPTFGGIAFVSNLLAVAGQNGLINYFNEFLGWQNGPQNQQYYGPGGDSRFMTSDSNGTLYIPYAETGLASSPPPAVVAVPSSGGTHDTITQGLQRPFGAAAGP
jgi:hypothetical protein